MNGFRAAACWFAAIGVCLAPGAANASPGDLDPSFAGQGFERLTYDNIVDPVDVVSVGSKILVAANVASYYECYRDIGCWSDTHPLLARYTADGSPDDSFGLNGVANLGPDVAEQTLGPLAITEDGDIYSARRDISWDYPDAPGLWHFNADGAVDEEFPRYPVPDLRVSRVAASPGGQLVLTGMKFGHRNKLQLARINDDGSPDPSFGTGGVVTVASTDCCSSDNLLFVSPDGSITMTDLRSDEDGLALDVYRFDKSGSPIRSFGDQGRMVVLLSGINHSVAALAATPDGNFLLADAPWRTDIAENGSLYEFDAQGQPVEGFGDDGTLSLTEGGLVGQLDIDAAGHIYTSGPRGVMRLLPDGRPDSSYGSGDGAAYSPWLWSTGGTLLDDGRFTEVGTLVDRLTTETGHAGALLVRRHSEGPPDSDADGRLDSSDECPDVPGSTGSGCPRHEFEITYKVSKTGEWVSVRFTGSTACTDDRSAWRLVRRRGASTKEYLLKNTWWANFDGWGRYYFKAPRRLMPESGICPGARSAVIVRPRD